MTDRISNIEFAVTGSLPHLIEIMNDVVAETRFSIEPLKWTREADDHLKYKVYVRQIETDEKLPCGSLEFIKQKAGRTQVRLNNLFEPSRAEFAADQHLDRLFYLYLQRLMELGIVDTGLPKSE